jgi:hypothetical protein
MTGFELTAYIGFVVIVMSAGLASLVWPEKVMAMRRRFNQSDSWWNGGVCYSTPRLTRLTGAALLIIGLIGASPFVQLVFGA